MGSGACRGSGRGLSSGAPDQDGTAEGSLCSRPRARRARAVSQSRLATPLPPWPDSLTVVNAAHEHAREAEQVAVVPRSVPTPRASKLDAFQAVRRRAVRALPRYPPRGVQSSQASSPAGRRAPCRNDLQTSHHADGGSWPPRIGPWTGSRPPHGVRVLREAHRLLDGQVACRTYDHIGPLVASPVSLGLRLGAVYESRTTE